MTGFWYFPRSFFLRALLPWGEKMRKTAFVVLLCVLLTACAVKELTDGTYYMDVSLSGGSGRAGIESPALVVIEGGNASARIVWSSPYYEYMIVDGERYEPVSMEGNSVFEIPVLLNTEMTVSASTIAMSQPHLIEYRLYIDSSTAKGAVE